MANNNLAAIVEQCCEDDANFHQVKTQISSFVA